MANPLPVVLLFGIYQIQSRNQHRKSTFPLDCLQVRSSSKGSSASLSRTTATVSSVCSGLYLSFNSHHPYTVKKGIVRCLQHQAKDITSDTDAYQEDNLHRENYLECITSAPRNLDRRIEDNIRKLTTVCLQYVK